MIILLIIIITLSWILPLFFNITFVNNKKLPVVHAANEKATMMVKRPKIMPENVPSNSLIAVTNPQ